MYKSFKQHLKISLIILRIRETQFYTIIAEDRKAVPKAWKSHASLSGDLAIFFFFHKICCMSAHFMLERGKCLLKQLICFWETNSRRNNKDNLSVLKLQTYSKDNRSVVRTPSSVSVGKISLKFQPPGHPEPEGRWCWPLLTLLTSIN